MATLWFSLSGRSDSYGITSDTRGPTSTNTTATVFAGQQGAEFSVDVDVSLTGFLFDCYRPGNYELWIDGSLISTTNGLAGSSLGNDLLAGGGGPVALSPGRHTFNVVKLTGSGGWYYKPASHGYNDKWLHMGYWTTAGGGELPGVRLVVDVRDDLVWEYSTTSAPTGSAAGHNYADVSITPSADIHLYAITIGQAVNAIYELLIDGIVVGTGELTTAYGTFNGPETVGSNIVLDTPQWLDSGVTYTFRIRRQDLAETRLANVSPGPGDYVGTNYTQADTWVDNHGTHDALVSMALLYST